MLVFAENFGQLSAYSAAQQVYSPEPSTGRDIYGQRLTRSGGLPGYNFHYMVSNDDFGTNHTTPRNDAYSRFFHRGSGRMSDNAILLIHTTGNGYWCSSPFFNKTKRVVVGMWIGPLPAGLHNSCAHPVSALSRAEKTAEFAFCFCSGALSDRTNQSSADTFSLPSFSYDNTAQPDRHVRVVFELYGGSGWRVSVFTFSADTNYTYPVYQKSEMVYEDASRPFFLEVYVDAANANVGAGVVKCAVNGKTIATFNNIYTLDVQRTGGNMLLPGAYYRQVMFGYSNPTSATMSRGWQVDGFYICDGSAGYQDDFLGPVLISTLRPNTTADGNEWTTVLNGAHGDFNQSDCVKLDYYCRAKFDEATYIESDQHDSRGLFSFGLPRYYSSTTLKAVQLFAVAEKQYTFSSLNDASPFLYPTVRLSGRDAVDVATPVHFPFDEIQRCMLAPMSVVPGPSEQWTWDHLANAEFGFTYYDGVWSLDAVTVDADSGYVNQLGNNSSGVEAIDGDASTYVRLSSSSSTKFLLLYPSRGAISDRVEVAVSNFNNCALYAVCDAYAGAEASGTRIPVFVSSTYIAGADCSFAPQGTTVAVYRISLPHPVRYLAFRTNSSNSNIYAIRVLKTERG